MPFKKISRSVKRKVPQALKRRVRFMYLEGARKFGFRPSPSLRGLDSAVHRYLPRPTDRPGFFIEAGANDGISQSNTYVLERDFNWQGLLIEPIPRLAGYAAGYRRSEVLRVALGSKEAEGGSLTLNYNDLRTSVATEHASGEAPNLVIVPVVTLASVLQERGVSRVDFFSLDVEGYENEVLAGFDFDTCSMECLLVETKRIESLNVPKGYFKDPIRLSHHDYLLLRA